MSIRKKISEPVNYLFKRIAETLQIKYLPVIYNKKIIYVTTDRWRCYRLNHEPYVAKTIKNNLGTNNIFFDVGAYYGYWTLYTSQIVGTNGKVVAFEPSPSFHILTKNIDSKHNCTAYNYGVSNCNGNMTFFAQGESSSSSFLKKITKINEKQRPGIHIDSIEKETITLDSFYQDNKLIPNLIKIDVEGHEYKVLEGAVNLLTTHAPKLIIEIHPPQLKFEGNDDEQLLQFLNGHDYSYDVIDRNINSIYTIFANKIK